MHQEISCAKSFLGLGLVFFLSASSVGIEASTDLPQFLDQYFKNQPTLRALESDARGIDARSWASRNRWDNQLAFSPAFGEVIPSDSGQAFNLVGSLSQTLPSGTVLSFEAQRNFATGGLGATPELSISGKISQPLWKNALGVTWRTRAFALSEQARAARLDLDDARWGACIDGIGLFLQAWGYQEKTKIMSELVASSTELLKWSEKAHRNRLIRKRELLAARADRLRVEEQELQFKSEKESAMGQLAAKANLPRTPDRLQRVTDKNLPDWGDLTEDAIQRSRPYLASQFKLSSREAELDAAHQEARIGVDVFFEGGRQDFNFSGVRTSSNFYQGGLELQVPLFSPQARGGVREAIAARAAQEARVEEQRRNSIADLRTLRSEYSLARKRLSLFVERIKVYQEESKAARQDLEQSRVEIDDYLRTRDRWLNERIRELDARISYWLKGLEVGRFSSEPPKLCGGSGEKIGLESPVTGPETVGAGRVQSRDRG